jgi:hypothetical protein
LIVNLGLAIIGVLMAADWVTLVGGAGAGWVVIGLSALNSILHAVTGNAPIVKTSS